LQKRLETAVLGSTEFQKVHARSVHRILCSLKESPLHELLKRLGNLLHVVADESGDLLVGQEYAWVSVQKNEQIKVTAVPDHRQASEQPPQFFWPLAVVG
jgi:hypothetical protein